MGAAHRLILLLLICGLLAPACATQEEWNRFWDQHKDKGQQPDAMPAPILNTTGLRGTVGQLVTIDGLRLTQVRGYGLVVGLVDSGGSDGPDIVKQYMVKEIRRHQEIGAPGFPAGEILGGRDAVMVAVTGLIPAGAKKGDRFDVVATALGSQAKSLVGGRLVLCDLKLYADTPQGILEGKTLATASGPVFVSPFDRAGRATSKVDLRTGTVLGGGVVMEPRKIRLVLNDPRYSTAQQIMNRINSRFAGVDPLADAKSPDSIDLEIPDEMRDRKTLFLERVLHTTISDSPSFLEKRAEDLGEEIVEPGAELESIGVAWEAIGKIILPHVRAHYADASQESSYFAGRTGMRLGDASGLKVVAEHALSPQSPFRLSAIHELGYAVKLHSAGECLRKLLDDHDDDIRIRAYLALRKHNHSAITTQVLDSDNLILDVVDSRGPFLVYVQRLGELRIALFGKQMRCIPPAIFPGERNDGRALRTLITAAQGDSHLTVIYTNKQNGAQSPPLVAPLVVSDLVRFLADRFDMNDHRDPTGLALPYSEVVDILYACCKTGPIAAGFITEEMEASAKTDEDGQRQRQESEY